MNQINNLKEVGRTAWIGWTAGIVGLAIQSGVTGSSPIVWNSLTYLTVGFAIIAAGAAATAWLIQRNERANREGGT